MGFPRISANFATMASNYYKHNALPIFLKQFMDSLPAGSTSCCVQVSHSLNAAGVIIPQIVTPGRRAGDNPSITGGNGYYLLCVDEVEAFLTKYYGSTTCFTGSRTDKSHVKIPILGRQGVLLFRSGSSGTYGFHVELWTGSQIVQSHSISGNMNEDGCFAQPRLLFWEVAENGADRSLPAWLQGWWEVYDGNYYYYYFSDQPGAFYTERKPTSAATPPTSTTPKNYATVKMQAYGPILSWNGGTEEAFTRLNWTSDTQMNGTSSNYGQLFATKL